MNIRWLVRPGMDGPERVLQFGVWEPMPVTPEERMGFVPAAASMLIWRDVPTAQSTGDKSDG